MSINKRGKEVKKKNNTQVGSKHQQYITRILKKEYKVYIKRIKYLWLAFIYNMNKKYINLQGRKTLEPTSKYTKNIQYCY